MSENAWLIDSVATHRVCKHEKWFENLTIIKPEPIGTVETTAYKDEKSLTAKGIGDIRLQVRINHKNHKIIIIKLHTPQARQNEICGTDVFVILTIKA